MVSKKEEQIKQLWRNTFGDNDDFIRMYFKWVYKDKYALTIDQGGKIMSSLMLLPYKFNYYGTELPMGYIAGACTVAEERGKGWMSQLMNIAFAEMKRRRMALATLIPASASLFDFYDRYGFARAFEYSLCAYMRPEFRPTIANCKVAPIEKLGRKDFAYIDRKLKERPICVLHDRKDMDNIVRDICLVGGQVFVATRQDTCSGMAFATPGSHSASGTDEKFALVRELVYDDEETRQALLLSVAESLNVDRVVCRKPFTAVGAPYSYGMARVIDADRLIAIRQAACGTKIPAYELINMDVKLQTSYLLDYPDRKAYMSLMLD